MEVSVTGPRAVNELGGPVIPGNHARCSINQINRHLWATDRQIVRTFMDDKKSQLDLHVMCIQQQSHKHKLAYVKKLREKSQ